MRFLIPQGIGDSIWALTKIESANDALGGGPIHVGVACIDPNNSLEARALEFVRRFRFVASAEMYKMPMRPNTWGAVLRPGPPADRNGHYRYIADGRSSRLADIDYALMPNAPLERGERLETWLPGFDSNWNLMNQFEFLPQDSISVPDGYAVFYFGSVGGNTTGGNNRGPLWFPEEWVALGRQVAEMGLKVVVVGADYDREYMRQMIQPLLTSEDNWVVDMVGDCSIGRTLSIVRSAKFVISYQSGIGIVASYMGVPVGIFWRPKGDSISSHFYVSFEEEMASAWAPPEMIAAGKHLPLIYNRHKVEYITSQIRERKWI